MVKLTEGYCLCDFLCHSWLDSRFFVLYSLYYSFHWRLDSVLEFASRPDEELN